MASRSMSGDSLPALLQALGARGASPKRGGAGTRASGLLPSALHLPSMRAVLLPPCRDAACPTCCAPSILEATNRAIVLMLAIRMLDDPPTRPDLKMPTKK